MRWLEPADSFDAGDRMLRLFKPPIFDGPTTRGLYDPKTGAMWIVDSFPCFTPGLRITCRISHVTSSTQNLPAFSSLVSPWHTWLDPEAYRRHVDDVEALGVLSVASAHGPIMTGGDIHAGFDMVRGHGRRADHPRAGSRAARRPRREPARRRGSIQRAGGGSGIRTHGAHHPTVFKTVPFGRSGIPPTGQASHASLSRIPYG